LHEISANPRLLVHINTNNSDFLQKMREYTDKQRGIRAKKEIRELSAANVVYPRTNYGG